MAKLILTHDVSKLGEAGDVVTVKDGYARNYLVPRGLATRWTKGAQKQIDTMQAARRKRAIDDVETARSVRDQVESKPVTIQVRAGDNGRLFGAVTTATIAQALVEDGRPEVDRRGIEIAQPIKALGNHKVTVRLHPDVVATLEVRVVPAKKA